MFEKMKVSHVTEQHEHHLRQVAVDTDRHVTLEAVMNQGCGLVAIFRDESTSTGCTVSRRMRHRKHGAASNANFGVDEGWGLQGDDRRYQVSDGYVGEPSL